MNDNNLKGKRILVIIDEVPDDHVEVALIERIRDEAKRLYGVCMLFFRTNLKAANMVAVTQGLASRSNNTSEDAPWALFITKLPAFCLECSAIQNEWAWIKSRASEHTQMVQNLVKSIEFCMQNAGNAMLILLAVKCLHSFMEKGVVEKDKIFEKWQRYFSQRVTYEKFASLRGWSDTRKGLMGQMNLLLAASASAEVSDVLLGYHFAYRAVPDGGTEFGTRAKSSMNDCCGWLYNSDESERAVGRTLYYVRGPKCAHPQRESKSFYWQTTVFPDPSQDILVYFSSCRKYGYLSVHLKSRYGSSTYHTDELRLSAHKVIPDIWSSHSASMINLQNPRAAVNPRSLLETLLVAACCNAASISVHPSVSLSVYLTEIAAQLGLPVNRKLCEVFSEECFQVNLVPRYIFPGTVLAPQWNGLIGLATRQRKTDKFNLKLTLTNSLEVRCEAKDSSDFSTHNLGKAAKKLIVGKCSIGLLLVRGCCNYWKSGAELAKNLQNIQSIMRLFPKRRLGKVILISELAEVRAESLGSGEGQLVVMQVPDHVLGHGAATRSFGAS